MNEIYHELKTFDGKDNAREIKILLHKLGEGVEEWRGNLRRAKFLKSLIPLSVAGFMEAPIEIDPRQCHEPGAYVLLTQICSVIGVSINESARRLEETIRKK